jgi:transcriptional regulator with XRE-family HTH domain
MIGIDGWTFGERLMRLRKRRRISQRGLAQVLGVNFVNVSHWEADHYRPASARIEAVARALHVTTDYLLMGVEPEPPAKKQVSEISLLHHHRVADQAALAARKLPADRKCLGCQRAFLSQWIGNRLCPGCGGSGAKVARVEEVRA